MAELNETIVEVPAVEFERYLECLYPHARFCSSELTARGKDNLKFLKGCFVVNGNKKEKFPYEIQEKVWDMIQKKRGLKFDVFDSLLLSGMVEKCSDER